MLVNDLYVGFFVITFTTPPIALEPYKDENAPLTTSVRSIMETGISDHNAPLESPVSEGLPSSSRSTRFPIPPPATSLEPRIERLCTFIPLVLNTVTPWISLNISSNVKGFRFRISSAFKIDIEEGVCFSVSSVLVAVTFIFSISIFTGVRKILIFVASFESTIISLISSLSYPSLMVYILYEPKGTAVNSNFPIRSELVSALNLPPSYCSSFTLV